MIRLKSYCYRGMLALMGLVYMNGLWGQAGDIDCANATLVAAGTFNAAGPDAVAGTPAMLCFSGAGPTAAEWYKYVPVSDQVVTISACLGGVDTRLSVYSGSCPGGLSCLVSSDDFCAFDPGSDPYASQVTFCATAGDTIFIEWDNNWDGSPFTWSLSENPANCSSVPDCPWLIKPANGMGGLPLAPEFVWSPAGTGGVADSFEIFFGTISGSLNSLGSITDTSIHIVCLDFSTTYYWSIVPTNSNGSATGCTEFSFTTRAAPPAPAGISCSTGGASPEYVFEEEFDSYPDGWTGDIAPTPTNGFWIFPQSGATGSSSTGPAGAGSGSNYAYFEASGGIIGTASLVSPPIDLSSTMDGAELSFLMHAHGLGLGFLEVGAGTDPAGPFTSVFTWTDGQIQCDETEAWIAISADLTAWIGDSIFLEFRQTGTGEFAGDLAIDLVRVEACLPCDAPAFDFAGVVPACPSGFYVEVNVTDLGDGTPMFTNGASSWPATLGLNSLPMATTFGDGDTVTITLLHGGDPACDLLVGTFNFFCPPSNDICSGATVLSCGAMLTEESTNGATGGNPSSCEGTIGDGVWYSILGNGDEVSVTVTPAAASWEAQVDVYASSDGTCDTISLVCETASSNTVGGPVIVSWISVPGTSYFVNVGPWINGDPGGDFSIGVACACGNPPVFTDSVDLAGCPGSADIIVDISSASGNVDISNNLNGSAFTDVPPGVYTLPGFNNSDTVTISVNETGDPACVSSSIVTIYCPPANDDCAGAQTIMAMAPGTYSVSGSTLGADTSAAPPTCDGFTMNTAPGVWYEVQTDNQYDVLITTCSGSTTFDTKIAVYNGNCGTLNCVAANDDDPSCGASTLQSTLLLPAGSFMSGGTNGGIDIHAPVNMLVYVTGFGAGQGNFELEVVVIEILPLDLSRFTAEAAGPVNQVYWETNSETNTTWHVVERSRDGRSWTEIGWIEAAGESERPVAYNFTDHRPPSSAQYRLRTVDRDGRMTYSGIVLVEREDVRGFAVRVYPVPANDILYLQTEAPLEATVQADLIDLHGRILRSREWISGGHDLVPIRLIALEAGVYIVRVSSGAFDRSVLIIKK